MNYRSVADLNDLVVELLPSLPRDIEVIVGVPRSGLLVANLLALHLNLPLTDVEGLINGRMLGSGDRMRSRSKLSDLTVGRHVLVVDDSIWSGKQLLKVKERISEADLPHRVSYAAAYVKPGSETMVDYVGELVPLPRCFEWNIMHMATLLSMTCMDIDGVLCVDPTIDENDDGDRYLEFLGNARPLHIPTERVGWLVTCRLEKYRAETERWLAAHGVLYDKLYMMQYPDNSARYEAEAYSTYKAEIYQTTGAQLFIESSLRRAREIAELAQKPVFCTETREMIGLDETATRRRFKRFRNQAMTFRVRAGRKLRRYLRDAATAVRGRKIVQILEEP